MPDWAYQIDGLTKRYGAPSAAPVVANDAIDLAIERGEVFGLLGPNGAGKSTLVRQMVGLLRPDAGSIKLFGKSVLADANWLPRYVSFLPQRPLALMDLTVEEAIRYTGQLRGLSSHEARHAASALIDELDLSSTAGRLVGILSGGQHRLVGLAVALVRNVPVLVLDEPTNELDPYNRQIVWRKLLQVNRDRGTTIVLVTHNVLEAERVVRRVALLQNGRVRAVGTPGELKAQVDRRVRLEVALRGEWNGLAHELERFGAVVEATGSRRVMLVARDSVREAIDVVLAKGAADLDDFRVLSPSLEDVYLSLSGQKLESEVRAE